MDIIKQAQQGVMDVTLQGKFTFADHEAFREVLQKINTPEVNQVVIGLSGVSFVDSAAMGMLLLARDEASKYKKSLVLTGAEGQVKKMFDMANFQNLFALK